jgi:hypothetical protein
MKSFKVLVNSGSKNKASVADLYEIDGNISAVTAITKRYVYIDNTPYNRKVINCLKRHYLKTYYNNKSWLLDK